jgi:hypothetical protein
MLLCLLLPSGGGVFAEDSKQPSRSQDAQISQDGEGCIRLGDSLRVVELAIREDDSAAALSFLSPLETAGDCRRINSGEHVYIERESDGDTDWPYAPGGLLDSLMTMDKSPKEALENKKRDWFCVRTKGSPTCFWMSGASVFE